MPELNFSLFSTLFFLVDLAIRVGLSFRVIMRKRSHGVTLAWLVVILLFPFIGVILYLLFGENRISERRTKRMQHSFKYYQHWLQSLQDRAPVQWQHLGAECLPLHNLALHHTGLPAMAGNNLVLLNSSEQFLNSLIGDIEQARSTCHLQFYIWQEGGMVDDVMAAICRASDRGVACRILLDSIGSREFLVSDSAAKLQARGVRIREALPAGLIKALFARVDIRNHRKIVVIDGQTAYTGSQNMADPSCFKAGAGVGQWVDVMLKLRGPVVESLAGTFINDWYLESSSRQISLAVTSHAVESFRKAADVHQLEPEGDVAVQLVPSGPDFTTEAIHSLLLTTIYAARKELILTTPYFVPDDALLAALKSASLRGVQVILIIPAQNDSKLADYASRARFGELLQAGVHIKLFFGGLLHSKTITIDGDFALFGSVNFDMRSFWLNFETTLVIYDRPACTQLRELQQEYISSSRDLDKEDYQNRSTLEQFKENAVLLMGPLL
ncbi:cardiolipin synthase [Desulfosediminicola sp.]|uniref:cardiolipin synthase n=1 Tax=Desulfosediminicola sp. TaxID=2886825 RepID=UPI003AF2D2AE